MSAAAAMFAFPRIDYRGYHCKDCYLKSAYDINYDTGIGFLKYPKPKKTKTEKLMLIGTCGIFILLIIGALI